MSKSNNISKIKFYIFLVLVVVCLFILVKNFEFIKSLDFEKVSTFIKEKGAFSSLIYVGIFILKPFFVVIPTNLIAIVGGTLFGPVKGFLLTMVGFFISGTIAFYTSRLLGRDFVEGIIGNRFIKLDKNIEKMDLEFYFF